MNENTMTIEEMNAQRFFTVFYTGKTKDGVIVQNFIDTATVRKEYVSAVDIIKHIKETESLESVSITNVVEMSESDAMDWGTETIDENHPDFEKFKKDCAIDSDASFKSE